VRLGPQADTQLLNTPARGTEGSLSRPSARRSARGVAPNTLGRRAPGSPAADWLRRVGRGRAHQSLTAGGVRRRHRRSGVRGDRTRGRPDRDLGGCSPAAAVFRQTLLAGKLVRGRSRGRPPIRPRPWGRGLGDAAARPRRACLRRSHSSPFRLESNMCTLEECRCWPEYRLGGVGSRARRADG